MAEGYVLHLLEDHDHRGIVHSHYHDHFEAFGNFRLGVISCVLLSSLQGPCRCFVPEGHACLHKNLAEKADSTVLSTVAYG